jgi:positive regulator of sigma E activity
MADAGKGDGKNSSGMGSYAKLETILQMAVAVPAGSFIGLLLGGWLDRRFHTKWIAVALLFLGAAGGFIQLFTYLSRTSKRGGE